MNHEYFEAHESRRDYCAALQRRIDDGTIWVLEGSAGRAAMVAIKEGFCLLGPFGVRDYWGSYVPSRDEVQPGTPGSREYAEESQGAGYVAWLLQSTQQ